MGVRYLHQRGGTQRSVQARREVVVSAGTANTARLLQVSGIGLADVLEEIGVPVRHELPGVGENSRDHYAVRLVMKAKPGTTTLNELARGWWPRWRVGPPGGRVS